MKIVGERPLNGIMEQLADVRKIKVKEAFEKAAVKCKASGSSKISVNANVSAKAETNKHPKISGDLVSGVEEVKVKPPKRFMV